MLAAMTAAPLWVFLVFWTMSYDVYCGQTAVWIKMPLGMEVGLGHGQIVLDGDPAPLKVSTPTFRPMSIVAKGLDGSRRHLVRR